MPSSSSFFSFLKTIFYIACVSFGGPQSHYIILQKKLVEEKKIISQENFLELMSFCQVLPGPSSTQLITLIAYRKWGTRFAAITLFFWAFPACLLMTILSLIIPFLYGSNFFNLNSLKFLVSFAIGLLLHNALMYLKNYINKIIFGIITLFLSIFIFVFYHNPWIFPTAILTSIIIILFIKRNENTTLHIVQYRIKKRILLTFIGIFILAGVLSEKSRIANWQYRKPFNLFENTYRFGSTVFGGGNVLSSMMYEQYAVRKKTQYANKEQALIGISVSQTFPGPVFSYATYIGGLIFFKEGIKWQIIGCIIATIGIFLSGFLIAIFAYQIWDNLKKFSLIQKSLTGIHISVCAILISTSVYLFIDNGFYEWQKNINIVHSGYILVISFILYIRIMPIYFLFFLSLSLGLIFAYL